LGCGFFLGAATAAKADESCEENPAAGQSRCSKGCAELIKVAILFIVVTECEDPFLRPRRRSRPRLCVAVGPNEGLTLNAAAGAEYEDDDDEDEPKVSSGFAQP
jgi:hypothetical protein